MYSLFLKFQIQPTTNWKYLKKYLHLKCTDFTLILFLKHYNIPTICIVFLVYFGATNNLETYLLLVLGARNPPQVHYCYGLSDFLLNPPLTAPRRNTTHDRHHEPHQNTTKELCGEMQKTEVRMWLVTGPSEREKKPGVLISLCLSAIMWCKEVCRTAPLGRGCGSRKTLGNHFPKSRKKIGCLFS